MLKEETSIGFPNVDLRDVEEKIRLRQEKVQKERVALELLRTGTLKEKRQAICSLGDFGKLEAETYVKLVRIRHEFSLLGMPEAEELVDQIYRVCSLNEKR